MQRSAQTFEVPKLCLLTLDEVFAHDRLLMRSNSASKFR